jgi:glycosyltransferase involved in cell wall biosynthesis
VKIDFLSHTAMGGDFVVGSHHLAAALAARGHEVRHVSAPVTPAHVVKLGDAFVRRRCARFLRGGETLAGVRDIVPFAALPWGLARSTPALMRAHSRAMLAAPFRGIGGLRLDDSDCVVVDEPRLVGLALSAAPRATLAYRATDLYGAMRGDGRIADAERLLCRAAHLLIATSEPIAAHLRALSQRQAVVIGNGVDGAHFATPRDWPALLAPLPGERARRAVYVGAFDARFSREAVIAAARALPERIFVLAGPGGEPVAAAAKLPNLHATGAVPYAQLPALLQSCAVGLLPFADSDVNVGRSPMKLFEYAAAGLAVAATAGFRAAAAPPALTISPIDSFAEAVERAFEMAADADLVAASRTAARAQDWDAKAGELLRLLQAARAESRLEQPAVDAPLVPVRD